MPINVQCKGCSAKFQAPDESAGKQVKCPKCSEAIEIPSPDERTRIAGRRPAQPANLKKAQQLSPEQLAELEKKRAARKEAIEAHLGEPTGDVDTGGDELDKLNETELPEWHVQTDDGEEYGPVTRAELEEWVADGRLDQTCQVIHEDWDQWKWAEEEFPELGDEAAAPEPDNVFDQWAAADSSQAAPVIQTDGDSAPSAPIVAESGIGGTSGTRSGTRSGVRSRSRSSSQLSGSRHRRYPALVLSAKIYEIMAWVVAVLGGLQVLGILGLGVATMAASQDPMPLLGSVFLAATVGLYAFLMFITMRAFAELIRLFFNMEEDNTELRKSLDHVTELLTKDNSSV